MDFKEPENILEFIKFQKTILKKYRQFIKHKIIENYKKAAIFVYWLNDYIDYIKAEATFDPGRNITYKRGQIVFVNFGFRIGNELGGNHYAVVLDTKNSKHSKTLTVVPLKSKKPKETKYSSIYHVSLGSWVKELLENKAFYFLSIKQRESLSVIKDLTNPIPPPEDEIRRRISLIKRNKRIAQNILNYTQKLKTESVADVGQITTISKQRINHPCKSQDLLTGVILPNEVMLEIENKIKKLYLGV